MTARPATPSGGRLTAASRRAQGKLRACVLLFGLAGLAPTALAEDVESATVQELRRQIDEMRRRDDEMRRRVEQLEALVARGTKPPRTAVAAPVAVVPRTPAPPPAPVQAQARGTATPQVQASQAMVPAQSAPPAPPGPTETNVPGLAPPELVGNTFEDALRADLPGVAFRVPGADTQVRLYGFAKLSGWVDAGGRNQTDAPLPGGIPLRGGAADRQGGDFGMTARFSRFGVDTRTLTDWGTLETRLEGDFGGGSATSSNALFRLRQAWAELGDERLRVLIGQTNSLWNEGLFETLIDATNLNQSFIRQAQLRVTGRLAPGLTGQVSVEAPETQFTSATGVVTPDSRPDGVSSPAFNGMPDFHGRLTYRQDGLEVGGRAMLRQLQLRGAGTSVEAIAGGSHTATGYGVAGHLRFPMRWIADSFGPDELLGLAYYGEGIGRYFAGSTNGLDALTNLGLPGAAGHVSFDAVPAWGATAAYRRFWTGQLRSNFSYSYARQDFRSYALDFTPGSASATGLNRDVQQVFANLIWSPFGGIRNGVFGASWLDVGFEYLLTRRDLFGGAAAAGAGVVGHGIANRFLFATIARF